ncbi:MAG: hypothetical protein GF334_03200 [Candidatus Altiarchaeales archaeon]|nr:hypothetical protein [Candidatus Altiarchaeales archaeon]
MLLVLLSAVFHSVRSFLTKKILRQAGFRMAVGGCICDHFVAGIYLQPHANIGAVVFGVLLGVISLKEKQAGERILSAVMAGSILFALAN